MAKIVLGVGSSHSPILLMDPPAWLKRGETDDQNRLMLVDQDGLSVKYPDLLAKASPDLLKELDPGVLSERHARNEAGMAEVARLLEECNPDVVIAIG
ncbi:hypothetical protein, partial [Novosphingobium sp.]|uniref:hypothetical protein n=1 Tax=Novosphingobium sp. TaxID=1874826 RepID=UPI002631DFA1